MQERKNMNNKLFYIHFLSKIKMSKNATNTTI